MTQRQDLVSILRRSILAARAARLANLDDSEINECFRQD
jgi:hypothetical protein